MKKIAAALLTLALVTGYTAAAHNSGQAHAGDSGTGATSDTPNAGKTANPETTGKSEDVGPNQTGPAARVKGLSTAITKVPGNVADAVLKPIQSIEPGKALGDVLSGVGEILGMEMQQGQAGNTTENQTQQP